MLNEKRIHYLIVAALAASFSSDATAAPRPSEDLAFERTTPARASSRGFAACDSTDTAQWNSRRNICESTLTPDDTPSPYYEDYENDLAGREETPTVHNIDLGDGRQLKLDSIRYEDENFATTLDASHSLRPIAIELGDIARQLEEFDSKLQFVANSNQHNLWSYVGRVVQDGTQEAEVIEGTLPLKLEVQQTADAGPQLSIAVDGEALIQQLK